MEEKDCVSIVFMPKSDGNGLSEFQKAVLLQYSGTDIRILKYGVKEDSDSDARDELADEGVDVRFVYTDETGRNPSFITNDILSRPDRTLCVDITFASSYHAAEANYYGMNGRVEVYHTSMTRNGLTRVQMNPKSRNYAMLDEDSLAIVMAVRNGRATVMDIVNETGFSEKKVYRKVLEMRKEGYLTCDDSMKQKLYSLTSEQETVFMVTTGIR